MAIKVVRSLEAAKLMISAFNKLVSLDIETTCLYPWHGNVVSIGFGTDEDEWVIPVSAKAWDGNVPKGIVYHILVEVKKALKGRSLCAQNGKFDCLWLLVHYGILFELDFDTMLAHHLLNENARHGIDDIVKEYLGEGTWDVPLAVKNGLAGTFKMHANYLAKDLRYTHRMAKILVKELYQDSGLKALFNHLVMPLSRLMTRAEFNGVYIDQHKYATMDSYLKERIIQIEAQLNAMAPNTMIEGKRGKLEPINWGSAAQVGKYLYGQLKIKPPILTPTGKPSTSADALAQIDHPIIKLIESYREAKQQWSFFIEGWRDYMVHGRLHPSFKIHGTVTGRLSCANPNLQQVPRDKNIRSLITAPPGWVLIEADLSQVELRVAGEVSGDSMLMTAYATGKDLHWLTAVCEIQAGRGMHSEVMYTALELLKNRVLTVQNTEGELRAIIARGDNSGEYSFDYDQAISMLIEAGNGPCEDILPVWKDIRKKAKAVNFGFLYGMYPKKFQIYARTNYGLELTEEQCKQSRDRFFDTYSSLPDWHERQKEFAAEYGYVRSLAGRIRHLPEATGGDKWDMKTSAALRQSINSPVQSFASDWLVMSILQMDDEFSKDEFRIIGTVHDAFLAEVREDRLHPVATRVLEIMKRPKLLDTLKVRFNTPMEADLKAGPWGSGKEIKL